MLVAVSVMLPDFSVKRRVAGTKIDGWLVFFSSFFNIISVISARWLDDNKSQPVSNGTKFTVGKISPQAGLESGTARSTGQRLTL